MGTSEPLRSGKSHAGHLGQEFWGQETDGLVSLTILRCPFFWVEALKSILLKQNETIQQNPTASKLGSFFLKKMINHLTGQSEGSRFYCFDFTVGISTVTIPVEVSEES